MINEFGNTLDAILDKKGTSKSKLCLAIDKSATALSFYCRGHREIPIDILGKITHYLNLNKSDESILLYSAARDMRVLKHDSVKMSLLQRDTVIRLMLGIHELDEAKVLAIRKLLK